MGTYLPYPSLITPAQWASSHKTLTGDGRTLEEFTQEPWDASDGWVFHWPGGTGDNDGDDPKPWLRGIEAYHIRTLGWDSVAYNYAIDRGGNVYGLVGETRGNATKGKTATTRAVLFLYADEPTAAMKNAALNLWDLAPGEVRGHRDWRDEDDDYDDVRGDCPGDPIYDWLRSEDWSEDGDDLAHMTREAQEYWQATFESLKSDPDKPNSGDKNPPGTTLFSRVASIYRWSVKKTGSNDEETIVAKFLKDQ